MKKENVVVQRSSTFTQHPPARPSRPSGTNPSDIHNVQEASYGYGRRDLPRPWLLTLGCCVTLNFRWTPQFLSQSIHWNAIRIATTGFGRRFDFYQKTKWGASAAVTLRRKNSFSKRRTRLGSGRRRPSNHTLFSKDFRGVHFD